jgi:hypothetical protein
VFYLRLSRLNDYDRVKNIPISFFNKGDVNIEFNFEYGYLSNLIVSNYYHLALVIITLGVLEFIAPILLELLFSFMFTLIPIILLTKKRPIDIIKFNQ